MNDITVKKRPPKGHKKDESMLFYIYVDEEDLVVFLRTPDEYWSGTVIFTESESFVLGSWWELDEVEQSYDTLEPYEGHILITDNEDEHTEYEVEEEVIIDGEITLPEIKDK